MARLYLSQERLDTWVQQDHVQLAGDHMTFVGGKTFHLVPAVRFLEMVGGGADPHQLIGKVKTHGQLSEMGVEHYMNSVLFGEIGYEVQQGFIGEPADARAAAGSPSDAPPRGAMSNDPFRR